MTSKSLINLALLDLGAIPSGGSGSGSELADGLATLISIVQSWSLEELTVPQEGHTSFALAPGTSGYTLGPAGTWALAIKPVRVTGAVASSGGFQNGLDVMPMAEFAVQVKNAQGITAALPSLMGVDNGTTIVAVRVWPPPNAAAAIEVHYWIPLGSALALDTALALPLGFELALRYALAVALYPQYPRHADMTVLAGNAQSAKQAIVGLNQAINGPRQQVPAAA